MKAPAIIPNIDFRIAIMSGPDKGTMYKLVSPVINIGRDSDNDIAIQDAKCSRRHAVIRFNAGLFVIENVSEKNKLFVNGIEVDNVPLNDGALITIGETELQFKTQLMPLMPLGPNMPQPGSIDIPEVYFGGAAAGPQTPRRRNKANGSVFKRILIWGSLILIIWWLFGTESKKKNEAEIRTEEQINAEIESAKKLEELAMQRPNRKNPNDIAHEEAQTAYVRGFRDYKKGQFSRAMESFQACLSLDPNHVLCNRYLRLSQRKFNELVQYHMILGRKYRDQHQYNACESAFRNVMVMIKDTSSKIYEEAKANRDACNAFLEDRF